MDAYRTEALIPEFVLPKHEVVCTSTVLLRSGHNAFIITWGLISLHSRSSGFRAVLSIVTPSSRFRAVLSIVTPSSRFRAVLSVVTPSSRFRALLSIVNS
jgi:hypothetical protein